MSAPVKILYRDRLGKIFLVFWGTGISIILSLLTALHELPFASSPALASTSRFTHQLNGTTRGWQMLHVVVDGCRCSGDVIEHLLDRKRESRVNAEGVLLIGHRPDLEHRFFKAGFTYREIAASELVALTGIEAAPTLVILDAQGLVRYTGGYYEKRERTHALDRSILSALMAGRSHPVLPTFGCAFSRKLQAAVDPLGLKYSPTFALPMQESRP